MIDWKPIEQRMSFAKKQGEQALLMFKALLLKAGRAERPLEKQLAGPDVPALQTKA